MKKGLWVWGYVLDEIPGEMPHIAGKTYCSLETGADYFGADSVVYMNSWNDMDSISDKYFKHIGKYENIICSLTHGHYLESARKVSKFSLKHKNIKGVIIDDFMSKDFKPADLKALREALKSKNQELKLYLVRYTWQDPKELIPYIEYFDVINLWVWVSTDHFWKAEWRNKVEEIKTITGKPVIQGMFIHDYGRTWHTSEEPLSMELTQLQCKEILDFQRLGMIQGCVILQNGWFCRENHREQIQWLKNYIDWFYGTTTSRI